MKIAYLISQYPAPSHTFIRREIAALRRLGLDIDTYSIRRGHSLSGEDRREEARTCYVIPSHALIFVEALLKAFTRRPRRCLEVLVATLRLRSPGAASLVKSMAYFVEAMRLAVELERRGATHLHSHFANPASHVGLAASRYLGIGWSLTLHGLSDLEGPGTAVLGEKIAAARFVATATQFGCAQAMRLSDPAQWTKLHVVRCGVEVEKLPRRSVDARRTRDAIEFLAVGRLSAEKGHIGLVKAFAKIVAQGVDARLVIIGGGPDEHRLRGTIREHGLGGRVELRGSQPESAVLEAMLRSDVFVLSSFMEGLPVVLMEALALEVSAIAPAITGIPELVTDQETGLLFPAGDWDALAQRMLTLARDPDLRARLGAAGKARVLGAFDVARAVTPLARLFWEAHSGGERRSAQSESGVAVRGT